MLKDNICYLNVRMCKDAPKGYYVEMVPVLRHYATQIVDDRVWHICSMPEGGWSTIEDITGASGGGKDCKYCNTMKEAIDTLIKNSNTVGKDGVSVLVINTLFDKIVGIPLPLFIQLFV
jgi:hypothetical protein